MNNYMLGAANPYGIRTPQYQMTSQPVYYSPTPTLPTMPTYPTLPGRTVMNPDDVRPNEVPMDGSVSFFPMNDYSCIYAKIWGNDGQLKTFKFVPEKVPEQKEEQPSELSQIMARLDTIEKALAILCNNAQQNQKVKYNNNNQKKENVGNGQS